MITVTIDPQVGEYVRIGLVEARQVLVRPAEEALRAELDAVARALRGRYTGLEPAQIDGLQPARELYRRLGIDPTRLRPSSEALLRRVLRGEEVPAVNSLVDAGNLCSLDFLLPVGMHDLGLVHGAVTLRRGRPIEMFEAIGKSYYSVEGRLVLADETGPCGTPTSDSVRTMITDATVRCLMVLYAPSTLPAERMADHVRTVAARVQRYTGGTIVGTAVLP